MTSNWTVEAPDDVKLLISSGLNVDRESQMSGISFGRYVLDLEGECLVHDGREAPLRAKTFSVLRHLASSPKVVVTKESLFETVWKNAIVSESVLAASISELRKAFDEAPRNPHYIQTVHRRGDRFIA